MAEAAVTTFLTVLLGMMLAATMATFARPSAEVEHRARLALEANLTAEALAYDVSDYVLESDCCLGSLEDFQAIRQSDWRSESKPWEFLSENNIQILRRTFKTPGSPVPTCVDYFRQGTHLIRRVSGASQSSTVVATHVTEFRATPCDVEGQDSPAGTCARIELTLAHNPDDPAVEQKGNCSATFILIALSPP